MEKLKSRKLWVWLIWSVLALGTLFIKDLPKETVLSFYGYISLMYIGSNTAQKWIFNKSSNPTK